jgi:L-amino acid N-acyltransferase
VATLGGDDMLTIRNATPDDVPAIRDLYNALITTTTVAWTETPETLQHRLDWFQRQQRNGHPVLVAEGTGVVVGFCSYDSFRGEGRWPGYRYTVEHTIHIDRAQWGAGAGKALMAALIEKAKSSGLHVMVGAIDSANTASLLFHQRLGFSTVGVMPQVGRKFGRWLDLTLVQLILSETP